MRAKLSLALLQNYVFSSKFFTHLNTHTFFWKNYFFSTQAYCCVISFPVTTSSNVITCSTLYFPLIFFTVQHSW